ncbi:MAG: 1-deoxy-D-xylulose-5-phosphate reductoisomerase [Propionibacteriaceae bacterium]|nr:1-deoxy-D-xylulose-5-phosphate reductoisomerase [Propionibacteriaceae bacterium]
MTDVIILGSTGSIGTQALDVIQRHPDRFRVVGLSAGGSQIVRLAEQVAMVQPARVCLPTDESADELRKAVTHLGASVPAILTGDTASADLARTGADVVLNAITGYAGLEPTLATLASGSVLALANKESLVVGGPLVMSAAAPGQIVPVDSEHSAFAQALRSGTTGEVARFILTASGGPFRGRTREQLAHVRVEQALAHPTWDMGRVVTINSSTLVNKGLELIEAAILFGVDWDRIQVVVHPQSVVHSMIEFQDGSTIAQCSPPDMRLPIALGLSWPDRLDDVASPCDWTQARTWTFEPLDNVTFPAVELARTVGKKGGTIPAVFNAANEVCVDAFCAGNLGFLGIVDTVEAIVTRYIEGSGDDGSGEQLTVTLDHIRTADAWARQAATEAIGRNS